MSGAPDAGAGGVLADLHVHVARALGRPVKIAASPRLTLEGIIDESVERKGLDVVGIVDAHSPPVLREIEGLVESGELESLAGGGLLSRKGAKTRPLTLVLASEVEAYEPGLGPVHYLCYLPDLRTAHRFSAFLDPLVTNVSLSSQRARVTGEQLARWAGAAGGFLVPAHVFTPFKGFFGQGGDDLSQAFSDKALEAVPAVELGLSSDSPLADLVPSLAPFTYLTNSDAHSPEAIAREHNAFARPTGGAFTGGSACARYGSGGGARRAAGDVGAATFDFRALAKAVREGRLLANYGLDPRLGKYHRAFCPKCGFTSTGGVAAGRACPACGRTGLVGGVLDRILALAGAGAVGAATAPDHGRGAAPVDRSRSRPPYLHLVPLRHVPGVGVATMRKLLARFGTEMNVLHRVPLEVLAGITGDKLANRICAARAGAESLDITPGAGGRYGRVKPGA